MASTRALSWRDGDDLWLVAGRYLAESGYATVSAFVDAIRAQNPQILNWRGVPVGAQVALPYVSS